MNRKMFNKFSKRALIALALILAFSTGNTLNSGSNRPLINIQINIILH